MSFTNRDSDNLERIANALERIATQLEPSGFKKDPDQASFFAQVEAAADALTFFEQHSTAEGELRVCAVNYPQSD